MAAPTNSGESDMVSEDFYSDLSSLLYSAFWPPRLTPSPPRHFLPSSSSVVMQYQGSNQSMDNPLQNQQQHEEDIVDPPPYLDGNSTAALWQQQLLQNMPELSNIQGFLRTPAQLPISQTNTGISQRNSQELESEEFNWEEFIRSPSPTHSTLWGTTNFTQSPTYSPLWGPTNFIPSPTYSPLWGSTNFTPSAPQISLRRPHIPLSGSGGLQISLHRPHIPFCGGPQMELVMELELELPLIWMTSLQTKGMRLQFRLTKKKKGIRLKDAANHLEVSRSRLKRASRMYTWPLCKEHRLRKRKRKEKNSGGERGNKKTAGVQIAIPLEDILQSGGMLLNDAAEHLKVTITELMSSCREYGIQRWPPCNEHKLVVQSLLNETIAAVDQEVIPQLTSHNVPFDQALMATIDTNSVVEREIPLKQFWPTAQQENLVAGFSNNGAEAIGIWGEGTGECVMEEAQLNSRCSEKKGKRKVNTPGGERGNNRTTGVRVAISKEDILQTKGMPLKDAAKHLKDEDFGNVEAEAVGMGSGGSGQSDMEEGQLRYLGKEKRKEMTPGGERRNKKNAISLEDILRYKEMPQKVAAKHLEVTIAELMSSCREYGIQIWSPRNEHKLIMQPLPDETPAVVDQEIIPQLTSYNVPSDQALMATVDTNSVVEKEIPLAQFLPTAEQENLDASFGNDEAEAIGMGGEKTGEGVIEEAQLNSGCSKKQGKRKVNTPGGERGNNRTVGIRIAIPKEDILRTKGMHLKDVANHLGDFGNVEAEAVGMGSGGIGQTDIEEVQLNSRYLGKEKRKEMTPGGERRNKKDAISLEDILRYKKMPQTVAAKHLNVGLSTLKRACRGHFIPSWPPCGEHNQSRPNESPAVVDKEPIPQLNSDTLLQTPQLNSDMVLPSNQDSATIDTKSVMFKARYEEVTIKFRLSRPFRMVELEQEVKKRLPLEAETYNINYKDEDDDLVLIACDEDLEECISSSTSRGSRCHELFLKPK